MGEAKRRRLASTTGGTTVPVPAAAGPSPKVLPRGDVGVGRQGRFPLPDLGRVLWPAFRSVDVTASFEPLALHDNGDAREITGRLDIDLGDGLKRYCVTLRTPQTRAEVLDIGARARAAGGWCLAKGKLDETEVVGDSGERYRMILGVLVGVGTR